MVSRLTDKISSYADGGDRNPSAHRWVLPKGSPVGHRYKTGKPLCVFLYIRVCLCVVMVVSTLDLRLIKMAGGSGGDEMGAWGQLGCIRLALTRLTSSVKFKILL
ncbi:unnamed protein product [Arctogadus glacialis]